MFNDKFVWNEGLELDDSDDTVDKIYYDWVPPYQCCKEYERCIFCDEEHRQLGRILADKIYKDFFEGKPFDYVLSEKVMTKLVSLIKKLVLPNIEVSAPLHCSTKMQLLDMMLKLQGATKEEITRLSKK